MTNPEISKEKWDEFNIKELVSEGLKSVKFIPTHCIVRIDACQRIFQPLNIFRKKIETQTPRMLPATDEFEVMGLLILHDSLAVKTSNFKCANNFLHTIPRIIVL